jgi:SNW domain-containing protein 1
MWSYVQVTRDRERDVSERVALGMAAVPSGQQRGEAMYDARLFNQEQGIGGTALGADDAYNLYDKPLFADKGNAIYRPRANRQDEETYGGDGGPAVDTGRFKADTGFEGAVAGTRGSGPVEFESEKGKDDLDALLK